VRTFGAKCVTVGVLACLVDCVWTTHLRAIVAVDVVTAVLTIILINFLACFGHAVFIDHPQFGRRLLVTTAAALGAGAGTAIVLLADL
jgi:hypothetical protein